MNIGQGVVPIVRVGENRMPRIRRWFHVSHDINSDPEVWELTERFGDRAFRVWVEILSIADRYDGLVPGENKYLSSALAGKCKTKTKTVEGILKYAADKQWLVYDPSRRVRNHLKYRPTRGDKQIPEGKLTTSPPLLHTPTHSSKRDKKELLSGSEDPNRTIAISVLSYLNERAGTKYRINGGKSLSHVIARIHDGFGLPDLKAVIDLKLGQWANDAKMCKYLRPETLFGSKFESYLNETIMVREEDPNP